MTDADPTGWFEPLYLAARDGRASVPWDRDAPNRLLVEWAREHGLEGRRRHALVVGSGLGADAEYIAGLGFETVAFDVAPTAVRTARERFPATAVDYRTADLLDPPPHWREAFDFVLESLTVQSLPDGPRPTAIANVAGMIAPGGTLLVIATGRGDDGPPPHGPPWPLTRAEVAGFATRGVEAARVEELRDAAEPAILRWRAEFRRPASSSVP